MKHHPWKFAVEKTQRKTTNRHLSKLYVVVCCFFVVFCLKKRFFFLGVGDSDIVSNYICFVQVGKLQVFLGLSLGLTPGWESDRVFCLEGRQVRPIFFGLSNYFSEKFSPQTILWFFVLSFPDSSRTILTPTIGETHHLNEAMAASSLLCGTFLGLLLAGLVTWIYGRGAGRIMQLIQVDFPWCSVARVEGLGYRWVFYCQYYKVYFFSLNLLQLILFRICVSVFWPAERMSEISSSPKQPTSAW